MSYKFIDHTADIAVEVESSSIEGLFDSACHAWLESVLEPWQRRKVDSKKFLFTSDSYEQLLVHLLSELNFQLYTKRWIYTYTNIFKIEKQNNRLHLIAEVFGEPFNSEFHSLKEEIKAITFHQMKIEKQNEKYFTRIVFDI